MSESGGSTGMLAMVDRVGRAWTCGHMPPTPPDRWGHEVAWSAPMALPAECAARSGHRGQECWWATHRASMRLCAGRLRRWSAARQPVVPAGRGCRPPS